MGSRFWVETLGCPKNQVDSDKLVGVLEADGYAAADDPADADLVVVNTCAFVEEARQESIDTVLALGDARRSGAALVVTGCLAGRYGAAHGVGGGVGPVIGERRRLHAPLSLQPHPHPLTHSLTATAGAPLLAPDFGALAPKSGARTKGPRGVQVTASLPARRRRRRAGRRWWRG